MINLVNREEIALHAIKNNLILLSDKIVLIKEDLEVEKHNQNVIASN